MPVKDAASAIVGGILKGKKEIFVPGHWYFTARMYR